MNLRTLVGVLMLLAQTLSSQVPVATAFAPKVDYHQHLLSPALAKAWSVSEAVTAERLIEQLDAAGIQRALVLSLAYAQGSPSLRGSDEYQKVRAENDWTSQQAARYPDRLRAFCSFNPLRDYALAELDVARKSRI
jgi:predicted TIM-barrel fold metal-dependent hydrolase